MRYRAGPDESLDDALLRALFPEDDRSDGPPLLRGRPLYESIDVEALGNLFDDRPGATGRVKFEYGDRDVEVRSDGRIAITDGDDV